MSSVPRSHSCRLGSVYEPQGRTINTRRPPQNDHHLHHATTVQKRLLTDSVLQRRADHAALRRAIAGRTAEHPRRGCLLVLGWRSLGNGALGMGTSVCAQGPEICRYAAAGARAAARAAARARYAAAGARAAARAAARARYAAAGAEYAIAVRHGVMLLEGAK
jgi:hypothetical protein